jgi:hypothetical protein
MYSIAMDSIGRWARSEAGPSPMKPEIPLPPEPDDPGRPTPLPPPRPFDPEHPFPDYQDDPPVKPMDRSDLEGCVRKGRELNACKVAA